MATRSKRSKEPIERACDKVRAMMYQVKRTKKPVYLLVQVTPPGIVSVYDVSRVEGNNALDRTNGL